MAGIFSLFHDPTQNVKAPTVFGELNSFVYLKLKSVLFIIIFVEIA